jgi:Sulfotransferase domain
VKDVGGRVVSVAQQLMRRFRFGKPIVVVSGLPRSGTSMAMKMLAAGGMPVLTDGVREADESNPRGYYELEAVKELHTQTDTSWLDRARGKAVKVVSFLLTWLPENYDYKVIFMQRDLREVIASETTMLLKRGQSVQTSTEEQTIAVYEQHLRKVERFLSSRKCFSTLSVNYRAALDRPEDAARQMRDFVGRSLDIEQMARVADPTLYRNRVSPGAK